MWNEFWSKDEEREWWEQPANEVLELIESLSAEKMPDVLDLGCGPGRHAIALAKSGFNVTATDSSEEAINHLNKWADSLSLSIKSVLCDFLDDQLRNMKFHFVLSYNVIYHGYRKTFEKAIQLIHSILREEGLFFFTCPSREDGKYGFGEEIATHTFSSEKSMTPGDIHYFADESDLKELLSDFKILSMKKDEGYWDNRGEKQFYSNWQILVQKQSKNNTI